MTDAERLDALEKQAKLHCDRLDAHNANLVDHEKRLKAQDARIGEVSDQLDNIQAPITAVENWLEAAKVTASPVWYVASSAVGVVVKVLKASAVPLIYATIGVALLFGGVKYGCVPNPFVPPVPIPVPVPPGPIPPGPVPPAPIPLPGFRVLIVYDLAKITNDQKTYIFGRVTRDYLNSKAAVGPDGKTKEIRMYQAGVDVSGEEQWIQDAFQRHPGQTSWCVISNGVTGYDDGLPATADDAMKLFTKYAEGK
jgi:hypothetical protein